MRTDGYAPIRDYAAIGDGRTVALVALDGAIDWLCLPNVDSPPVFGRLLDARSGGSFRLEPVDPFESEQRYRPGTNVVETTFRTSAGAVRVTDALTLADRTVNAPMRELVRLIEGLAGQVRLRWCFDPRVGDDRRWFRVERRHDRIVFSHRHDALALATWRVGDADVRDGAARGRFEVGEGTQGTFALAVSHQEPLVFVTEDQAWRSVERTAEFWRRWSDAAEYDGQWRDAVVRSALVLKLLVFAQSGAIVAAPTTSLPERIGGERNWDYRYAWIRDATWSLDALIRLGYDAEAHAFFFWLMHASRLTQPRFQVLYRVNGDAHVRERALGWPGYRGSRPVRIGNRAVDQLQLDIYGSAIDSIWRYLSDVGTIDKDTAREIAESADWVVEHWREPDRGLWEARDEPKQYTQSKAMCWLALERARQLAEDGLIPDRHAEEWRQAAAEIRGTYERESWDEERGSLVRSPDLPELDASLLTLSLLECQEPDSPIMLGTIEAVRRELTAGGPFLYRYRGRDGLPPGEGAFLACSFWLAGSLARAGRVDEAAPLMEELLDAANHVGLYAEQIDPETRAFLGNFPQGLTHLALINAAVSIEEASR
jgi:GH15 family glucan-1,4-alpha-glucosidase